jgi:predicted dienelactone hydrolase
MNQRWLLWLVGLAVGLAALSAHASVGYREIQLPGTTMGVWYPSDAPAQARKLGPFELNYAFDGQPRAGRWPVIVFSHGNGGKYRNHYLSLQALAAAGFVVAAPQHTSDKDLRSRDFQVAFKARVQDIARAVTAIQADTALSAVTDTRVVHGLGYSLGGATMLAAAGLPVSDALIKAHCQAHASEDLDFCSDTPMLGLLHKFKGLLGQFSRGDTLSTAATPAPIQGALALVAPIGQGLVFDSPGLRTPRILDIAIDGDVIAPPRFHAEVIAQALPRITRLVRHAGHHYAFIAPIPKWALGKEDYFIINDPEGFDRPAFIQTINAELLQFFSRR